MRPCKITLKNFQSFDADGSTIEKIKRINLIIGPNNAGKSKLLRACSVLGSDKKHLLSGSNEDFEISIIYDATESAKSIFSEESSGGNIPGNNHWDGYGKFIENITLTASYTRSGLKDASLLHSTVSETNFPEMIKSAADRRLNGSNQNLFSVRDIKPICYISAERDINPEGETSNLDIQANGAGVTNMLRAYLNRHDLDSDLVEEFLLEDINSIASPEYQYERIIVQQIASKEWEIYLVEKTHGRVALSQCGSGIKTILQVVANLNLVIESGGSHIEEGLFIFEELENSLHPRTQRNLLNYIDRKLAGRALCVLSSHSSVFLDYFQGRDDVSITAISQSGGVSRTRSVDAFIDRTGVLDALGVKASDALHANCVIWVEGPTDRIYLKKFLEIISNGKLTEGHHFTIMFYGGKLLSHLTVGEPELIKELINLLQINRKAAVLIDSDRKSPETRIRDTKRRIASESRKTNAFVWTTKGREIENYLNEEFWTRHFNIAKRSVGPYEKIFEALENKQISGKAISTKIELAKWAASMMSENDFALDLQKQLKDLVSYIAEANEQSSNDFLQ